MLKEDITLAIAILGAVLAIWTFFYQLRKDKLRLRITPKLAYPVGALARIDDRCRLSIEIINMSSFPVTVCDVGLTLWFSRTRASLVRPVLIDGKPWPRRLEPREAVSVFADPTILSDTRLSSARRAYARTACDQIRYGNSNALRGYIKQISQTTEGLLAGRAG